MPMSVYPYPFIPIPNPNQLFWQWSQHKKLLPIAPEKGVRRTIPAEFAYFSVEWAGGRYAAGGYGHIIEDVTLFPVRDWRRDGRRDGRRDAQTMNKSHACTRIHRIFWP